jgi:hypothetical protein
VKDCRVIRSAHSSVFLLYEPAPKSWGAPLCIHRNKSEVCAPREPLRTSKPQVQAARFVNRIRWNLHFAPEGYVDPALMAPDFLNHAFRTTMTLAYPHAMPWACFLERGHLGFILPGLCCFHRCILPPNAGPRCETNAAKLLRQ